MMQTRSPFLLGFGLALACADPPGPSPLDPAVAPAVAPAGQRALPLSVDGVAQAPLTLIEGGPPVDLAGAFPPGQSLTGLLHVEVQGAAGRQLGIRNLSTRYPDTTPRLDWPVGGQPRFGLYREAPADADAALKSALNRPIVELQGATAVALAFLPPPAAPASAVAETLDVQVPGEGRQPLSAESLAALPVATDPRGKVGGWWVEDVAQARLGPDRKVGALILMQRGEAGSDVDLRAPEFAGARFLVKYNRDGRLRVQRWDAGNLGQHPDAVYKEVIGLRVEPAQP